MGKIRQETGKHFDYTFNFDFLEIIDDLVDRALENCEGNKKELSDAVLQAIDEGLIYSKDQKEVLEYYAIDEGTKFNDILEDLFNDVYSIARNVIEEDS